VKLTKTRLKQLIKEELAATLLEEDEPIINLEDTIRKWINIYQGAINDLRRLTTARLECDETRGWDSHSNAPDVPLHCVLKAKWFKKLPRSTQTKIIQNRLHAYCADTDARWCPEMRPRSREQKISGAGSWMRPKRKFDIAAAGGHRALQEVTNRITWAAGALKRIFYGDLYKERGWNIENPKVLGTLFVMSDKVLARELSLPYRGSDVLNNLDCGTGRDTCDAEVWHKYIMDKAEHVYYVEGPYAVLKKFGLVRRTGATRLKRYK